MVGAQVEQVVAGQRGGAVGGAGAHALAQFLEAVHGQVLGVEQPGVGAQGLVVHAETFQQAQREVVQRGVLVVGLQRLAQRVALAQAAAAQFQQAVAALGDQPRDFGVARAGAFKQFAERRLAGVGVHGRQLQQLGAESTQHLAAVGQYLAEGVKAFVQPALQHFLGAAGHGGGVQVDVAGLADAVEASDALLEHVRVQRQVPEHQVLGELEVAAFGADLARDQQARAFGVGEKRGVAVALKQVHVFVETRHLQAGAQAQGFFDGLHLGARTAQQQHLGRGHRVQGFQQPVHARVAGEVVRGLVVGFADVVREFGAQRAQHGRVFGLGQGRQVRETHGETADGGAAVAHHHPAGAVAVDQVGQQGVARGGIASGDARQALGQVVAVFREQAGQGFHVFGGQRLVVEQAAGQGRQALVTAGFGAEGFQVGVTRRVEQAQAGEVAAQAQLFGRGREQQQARRARRQRFNQGVTRAGEFGGPDQVVGFVHQQQVPARGQGLAGALFMAGQPVHRGDDALFVLEGIGLGFGHLQRFAALFVVDGEGQVEAPQQFDEPLVDQAFGNQHQHPAGAARGQHLRGDQAGFDGLAQADLIGQQQARRPARGGGLGHLQLVRHQVYARAQHAPARMRARFGAAAQAFHPELELVVAIHPARQQARIGLRHRLFGVERAFGVPLAVAQVVHVAFAVLDLFDGLVAALDAHALAGAEHGAQQRRRAQGVHAHHAGAGEYDLHLAAGQAQHRAQAKFGLGAGEPALAGGKKHVWLHSGEGDSTAPRQAGPIGCAPA